jgi:hypothetical protein
VDFAELATSSDNLELAMEEIHGRRGVESRKSVDSRCNLRQRFWVIVVSIQRADLRMLFNPDPDVIIGGAD